MAFCKIVKNDFSCIGHAALERGSEENEGDLNLKLVLEHSHTTIWGGLLIGVACMSWQTRLAELAVRNGMKEIEKGEKLTGGSDIVVEQCKALHKRLLALDTMALEPRQLVNFKILRGPWSLSEDLAVMSPTHHAPHGIVYTK